MPANQSSTDAFAGPLANQTNLAIKVSYLGLTVIQVA